MYKPEYFKAYELVPKKIYNQYGEKSLWFLDNRILIAADDLRRKYGKATINDWYWGGNYDSRGFRPPQDQDGANLSQHRFGRALDIVFESGDVYEIREDILDKPNKFPFINAVELDISWLHIDCRNCNRIMTFKP